MHSSQPTTRQPRHSHGPRRGSTSGGTKIAVSPELAIPGTSLRSGTALHAAGQLFALGPMWRRIAKVQFFPVVCCSPHSPRRFDRSSFVAIMT